MESPTTAATNIQPAKFTRYKSVRRATVSKVQHDTPPIPQVTDLNRTPSRYRRPSRPTIHTSPPLPSLDTVPVTPTLPQGLYSPISQQRSEPESCIQSPISPLSHTASRNHVPHVPEEHSDPNPNHSQHPRRKSTGRHERDLRADTSHAARPNVGTSRSSEAAREEARMILEGEYDRLQQLREPHKQAKESQSTLLQNHSVRPHVSISNKRKSYESYPTTARLNPPKPVNEPRKTQMQPAPRPNPMPASVQVASGQGPKPLHVENQTGEAAPVLQAEFDAPISAVNAGERRVELRRNGAKSGITLPVTPATTVGDLLRLASTRMSQSFDPSTAILVESFSSAGLERPLRRYEHIRDVINSWDTDSQNYLVIMSADDCAATGLERNDAPLSCPVDIMVRMSVSSRPGNWDKKWLTLRSDGQISASKYENDGTASNICHLSDFDVYTPTRKQVRKIKSPKKNCFAIKSLQKPAIFLEHTNFVHFFATNDKQTADRWYKAVKSWRSWYLVHVMGEGVQLKEDRKSGGHVRAVNAWPGTSPLQETVPYQSGFSQPLLGVDDIKISQSVSHSVRQIGHQVRSSFDLGGRYRSMEQRRSIDGGADMTGHGTRQTRAPPSAFLGRLFPEPRERLDSSLDTDDQAFTGNGLLARSASRRTQGGKGTGHGVTGVKGRPLVDLQEHSEFADGSLLRQLEAWGAGQGEQNSKHKIDRQRRLEANVKVGEGV